MAGGNIVGERKDTGLIEIPEGRTHDVRITKYRALHTHLRDADGNEVLVNRSVENAIDETAYDLNAASFSESSNIDDDYTLNAIELNFSTAEEKTITVTSPDGTILYEDTNTNKSVSITEIDRDFNGGENFTVAVTQFSSAGTMDCIAVVTRGGSAPLPTGNPVLGAGTNSVGTVGLDAGENVHGIPRPMGLAIPQGLISGYSGINKFGANADSADGATEDVWDGGGTYSFPTSALMTSMSQTTDQAAMRGETVEIQGLDANWEPVTQTKELDASDTTTVVTLDTPLIRCFLMKVLADVVCDSSIRVHNAGETQDYAIITAGNNQTLMAVYTVPSGYTAFMTSYYCDYVRDAVKDPDSTDFRVWVADRENGYEFQLKHAKGIPKQASGFQHHFDPYMKITQKSDIKVTSAPDGAAASVHAGFDLILVVNS